MRRWFFGGVSGLLTAATIAAAAVAAVNFRGPTAEELLRDIAVIDRELALAERTLTDYREVPAIAEQIALRVAVLETTRAMLEQKRMSWLRGINLIYRVDGWKAVPDYDALVEMKAKLADAEAGMVTARTWAARSKNDVTKNLALTLEQVHLLTHAAVRQQMALEGLGLALPRSVTETAETPAAPVPADRTGVVGALERPASVRR